MLFKQKQVTEEQNSIQYSVLMSVYNKENPLWLKESIESIFQQTVLTDDFVLVEDGPISSELETVIDKYAVKYPDILKVVKIDRNVGLGLALAKGLVVCKNELIVRMDSDDISAANRCECLLNKYMEDPDIDIIGSLGVEFETTIASELAIHRVPEHSSDIYKMIKRRSAFIHASVMYKKSSVLAAGNYRDLYLQEDYDLFIRMIVGNKNRGYNIPQKLYYIRVGDALFKRRGGITFMRSVIKTKYQFLKAGYINKTDFVISAGSQAIVCLMPNKIRKWIYHTFLRG